eukprot:c39578_g1_i1 orf=1-174(-)
MPMRFINNAGLNAFKERLVAFLTSTVVAWLVFKVFLELGAMVGREPTPDESKEGYELG